MLLSKIDTWGLFKHLRSLFSMVLIAQNKILMVEYDDYQFSLLKIFHIKTYYKKYTNL